MDQLCRELTACGKGVMGGYSRCVCEAKVEGGKAIVLDMSVRCACVDYSDKKELCKHILYVGRCCYFIYFTVFISTLHFHVLYSTIIQSFNFIRFI